jgi:hypothetical protein
MPRELVYGLIFIVAVLAAVFLVAMPKTAASSGPSRTTTLGQRLTIAAQKHDWAAVKTLLDQGADPGITQIDRQLLIPPRPWSWMNLFRPAPHVPASGPLTFPTALRMAIAQGRMDMVKMLLDHHAKLAPADIFASRQCGSREMIDFIENLGHVPLDHRSLPQAPFTKAGPTARDRDFPATLGAIPLRHFLWLSPHEIVLVRDNPPHFSSLDLVTGTETDLPDLTRAWAVQPQFDANSLALSPDGQWLAGFGGTADHPVWLATEVHGTGSQQWDRVAAPPNRIVLERNPPIAWRDNTRWVEINRGVGPNYVLRLRTLGSPAVQELPLERAGFRVSEYPDSLFAFRGPDHAFLGGQALDGHAADGPYLLGFMADLDAVPDGWHFDDHELRVATDPQPGRFIRCAPSPDGKRVAWFDFLPYSGADDLLLSDPDGKNFRIVYEKLDNFQGQRRERIKAPWQHVLEWTPDGAGLLFWRGEKGQGGLGYLPLSRDE